MTDITEEQVAAEIENGEALQRLAHSQRDGAVSVSGEKLSIAQRELDHWKGALAALDEKLREFETAASSDEQTRQELALRIVAEGDATAQAELTRLTQRALERSDTARVFEQNRARILRNIEVTQRYVELAGRFADAGSRISSYDRIMLIAARYDGLSAEILSLVAEQQALSNDLAALGIQLGGPASPYRPPLKSAADHASEASQHFSKSYDEAGAELSAFESNPRTEAEVNAQLRAKWAADVEAERLAKIAEKRRKEKEEHEAWERANEERARRQRENTRVIRLGDGSRGRAPIDLVKMLQGEG